MEDIEKIINAWYATWLLINDPFEDDFQDELEKVGLKHKFTLNFNIHAGVNQWVLI